MQRRVNRGVEFLWSVCLYVWLDSISSQLLGPSSLIFSGYVGVIYGSAQLQYEWDMLRNKKLLLVGPFCDILKKLDFHLFLPLSSPLDRSGWPGRNEFFGGGWGHAQEHLSLEPAQ